MTIQDKIQRHRAAYVLKYGKEPKNIILGYEVIAEIKREMPSRFIAPGASLYGMIVVRDNDKPTRIEVGDLTT